MRVTIDRAGRHVVPKALRDELGIVGGTELEAVARSGRIELQPVQTPLTLVERDGVLVAAPEPTELPSLTTDEVRAALEQARR